jgi:hypothetical protein
MAKAKEILEAAKDQDLSSPPSARLLLLHGNPGMVKLIVAWSMVNVRMPQYANNLQGLWEKCEFSMDEWLTLAGLPLSDFGYDQAENVIRLGMIYPDRTIPDWVNSYIQTKAAAILE